MPLRKTTLSRYRAPVFVETGSFHGEGVGFALVEPGAFGTIHTIELVPERAESVKRRFGGRVHVHQGPSEKLLGIVLGQVRGEGEATVWLDAHPGGFMKIGEGPLRDELEAISRARELGNEFRAVLIDDMRLFSGEDQEWLRNRLAGIFPGARIGTEHGVVDDDILVADIPPCFGGEGEGDADPG